MAHSLPHLTSKHRRSWISYRHHSVPLFSASSSPLLPTDKLLGLVVSLSSSMVMVMAMLLHFCNYCLSHSAAPPPPCSSSCSVLWIIGNDDGVGKWGRDAGSNGCSYKGSWPQLLQHHGYHWKEEGTFVIRPVKAQLFFLKNRKYNFITGWPVWYHTCARGIIMPSQQPCCFILNMPLARICTLEGGEYWQISNVAKQQFTLSHQD